MSNLSVPFQRASIGQEEEDAVLSVLRSGWLTTGSVTLSFEKEFSDFLGGGVECLAVNSNTSGMTLALEACGVRAGTKVITTPYTFNSTPMAARHLGADVIFCDTAPGSYNIDCNEIEKALIKAKENGDVISAIIPVHVAGVVCDMARIMALSKKFSVRVIEDCAHSFPSPTSLGNAGTIGDAGVFSFYATKTITTAEGGMVAVKDKTLLKRMAIMRMHGMDRTTWDRYTSPRASWEYDITAPGWKFNLPDILSAIGREQLKKANVLKDKRREIFNHYMTNLCDIEGLSLPPNDDSNSYHLFLLRVDESKIGLSRDDFGRALQKRGVGVSVHFIPCCNFTYWKNLYNLSPKDFPNAQKMYKATISLPLFPDMTIKECDYVTRCIKEILLTKD